MAIRSKMMECSNKRCHNNQSIEREWLVKVLNEQKGQISVLAVGYNFLYLDNARENSIASFSLRHIAEQY
jgi:hypothetical protein